MVERGGGLLGRVRGEGGKGGGLVRRGKTWRVGGRGDGGGRKEGNGVG